MKGVRVVVTLNCNFMCSICKLRCAPYKKGFMSVDDFYTRVNIAIEEGYRDYIIIEGGEIFLNAAYLYKYLKKIKGLNIKKHLVTNGFWGNQDIYFSILKDLKRLNIERIIVEYDYFHSFFVNLETIKSAIYKIEKSGLEVILKANLKTKNLSCTEDISTLKDLKILKGEFNNLKIILDGPNDDSLKEILNRRWTCEEKLILYEK